MSGNMRMLHLMGLLDFLGLLHFMLRLDLLLHDVHLVAGLLHQDIHLLLLGLILLWLLVLVLYLMELLVVGLVRWWLGALLVVLTRKNLLLNLFLLLKLNARLILLLENSHFGHLNFGLCHLIVDLRLHLGLRHVHSLLLG